MERLTSKDISFYEEHGWWVSPVIVDSESIDDLIFASERYYAGDIDTALDIRLNNDWHIAKGNILRQNDYISLQMSVYRNFLEQSIVAEFAGKISSTNSVRLFHDQLIYKPPRIHEVDNIVGWHIDKAYWQTCTSEVLITAWIPFQDTNEENGTLCVVDRSHLWDYQELQKSFHTKDLKKLEADYKKVNQAFEIIPLNLKKGQVSFHHCKTIHGSQANISNDARLAYAIHFQDHSNRYRKVYDRNGNAVIHSNDIICVKDRNGVPNYSDAEVCPTLWKID
ncbi:phytanoyl-CoA dioxygenase family protein [Spirosoma areae]